MPMTLRVEGRSPLNGVYRPSGNANAAQALLVASLMTEAPVTLRNMPRTQTTEAMIDIDREAREDPELVKNAPHSTRIGRLDEAAAARKPVLRWRPDMEAAGKSA